MLDRFGKFFPSAFGVGAFGSCIWHCFPLLFGEPPRAAQRTLKSGLGGLLGPTWRPRVSVRPPGTEFDSSRIIFGQIVGHVGSPFSSPSGPFRPPLPPSPPNASNASILYEGLGGPHNSPKFAQIPKTNLTNYHQTPQINICIISNNSHMQQ